MCVILKEMLGLWLDNSLFQTWAKKPQLVSDQKQAKYRGVKTPV